MARPPTPFNLRQLTQAAAAELLGVTTRALRDWELSGQGVPRNPDSSYPGPELVAWWKARGGGGDSALDLNAERARLAKWQADKAEQDVELRAGRMLDADQVEAWIDDMLATVTARLVQIPDAIAVNFDKQVATRVAAESKRFIYEALADLAAAGTRVASASVAEISAAADSESEPVGGSVSEVVERKQRGTGAVAN